MAAEKLFCWGFESSIAGSRMGRFACCSMQSLAAQQLQFPEADCERKDDESAPVCEQSRRCRRGDNLN